MLVITERTVYRRMAQFSLSKYDFSFSSINNEDLDFTLSEIAQNYPVAMKTRITHYSPQIKSCNLNTG